MRCQLLSLLCWIIFLSTCVWAQEIDPMTGQPANLGAPANLPEPDVRRYNGVDQEKKLVLRSQTVLVQVPVVVSDKSGSHVGKLTRDDFKILEDGKQQRIAIFQEVNSGNARPVRTTNAPGTFSNITLEQQPSSITVIALDTINTPFLDQTIGRKQLIKYLADNLESGRVFGLVVIGRKGLRGRRGLT